MQSFFTDLATESVICAQCGYCQAACPVYQALGWESTGPRGHMLAARLAAAGQPLSDEHARRLYECTLCGQCRAVCATRIDTTAAWLKLREHLAAEGRLEGRPLARLRDNLQGAHNITGEGAEARLLWQDGLEEPVEGLNGRTGAELVYFVGCVAALYPQGHTIAQSLTQVLAAAGASFTTLGGEEWCCGFPLLGMGLREEAVAVAQHNVQAIKALGAKAVVTACPSCYHVWRHFYAELLGQPLEVEVLHQSQLLATWLLEGRLNPRPLRQKVTYHDPCDLGRNGGEYEAPRAVLRAIPGLELIEMADNRENALCCGGGGNLEAVNPALAAQIADRRLAQALETGASILVTPCQQCKRTLAAAARRRQARLKVLDLAELIWQVVA